MVEKNATPNSEIMKTLGQMTDSMNHLADEIHALRLELTPSLRKTEALQDLEAARKLRLINLRKKAAGGK